MTAGLLGLIKPLLALAGATAGLLAVVLAAATDPSSPLGPWAGVGGAAAAVSCLVYIATLFARGQLVSVRIADVMREGAEREKTVIALAQDNHAMADRMWRRWGDGEIDRGRDRRQDEDR